MSKPPYVVAILLGLSGCGGGGGGNAGGDAGTGGSSSKGAISGLVVGVLGEPIIGATVNAPGGSTVTKQDGRFRMQNVDPGRVSVAVTAPNMFTQYVGFDVVGGNTAYRDIAVIPKGEPLVVNAATGGAVANSEFDPTLSISVPAGALELGDQAFTGEARIYAQGVTEITGEGLVARLMPGSDFRGSNAAGDPGGLSSLGFVALSVENAEGKALEATQPLEITITVPAATVAALGADARQWSFNPGTATWSDAGPLTVVGTDKVRIRATTESAYWNADVWSKTGTVAGKVIDCIGKPAIGAHVSLKTAKANLATYTDGDGRFRVDVPAPYAYSLSCDRGGMPARPSQVSVAADADSSVDVGQFIVPCLFEGPLNATTSKVGALGCEFEVAASGTMSVALNGDGSSGPREGQAEFRGTYSETLTNATSPWCWDYKVSGSVPMCALSGASGAINGSDVAYSIAYTISAGTVSADGKSFTANVVGNYPGFTHPLQCFVQLSAL